MLSHSDILLEVHDTILIDIWTMNTLSIVLDQKKKKNSLIKNLKVEEVFWQNQN